MSVVVSFRIPRELKERMDRFRDVNWSDLVRRFLEETVAKLEAERTLERISRDLEDVPELPRGIVAGWLRSDRESR